jgi:hypothetical protein
MSKNIISIQKRIEGDIQDSASRQFETTSAKLGA